MPLQENEEKLFAVLEMKEEETRVEKLTAIINELTEEDDINCKNRRGHSPLWIAVLKNDMAAVRLLVKANADVNAKNIYGYNVLMLAIKENYHECAGFLIQAGADINAKTNYANKEDDINVWEMAIHCKNFGIATKLLEKKVKITIIHDLIHFIFETKAYELINLLEKYNSHLFIERIFEGAAYYGDIDIVNRFIHRISSDILDRGIEYALRGSHFNVILKIREHLPLVLEDEMYLLKAAIKENCISYIKSVSRRKLQMLGMNELLVYAAEKKSHFALKKLLDIKADVNTKYIGKTALYAAIQAKEISCIRSLLEAKADPNLEVADKMPLIVAISINNLDGAKLLLEHKANPNYENGLRNEMLLLCGEGLGIMEDIIPLHIAMMRNNLPMMKLLVEYKANIDYPRVEKSIKKAIELGRVDCLEYLIEAKVDLKQVSEDFKPSKNTNVLQFAECMSIFNSVKVQPSTKVTFIDSLFMQKQKMLDEKEIEYIPLQRLKVK